MRRFGLIGYPLSHSFSANYFNNKFKELGIDDCVYELYPIEQIEHVRLIFQSYPDLAGLNVTIPYKELVIPYLDEMDTAAQKIGAVNCIRILDGIKTGFNTDYIGFVESVKPYVQDISKKAIVLGTGGASKAICYALSVMQFEIILVSRNAGKHTLDYSMLTSDLISDAGLIINTTPLGMHPETTAYPKINYNAMHSNQIVFDVIYNPEKTQFLEKAMSKGASIINGMEMLKLQAEEGWRIWNS